MSVLSPRLIREGVHHLHIVLQEGQCFALAASLDTHKALVHIFFAQRSTKKVKGITDAGKEEEGRGGGGIKDAGKRGGVKKGTPRRSKVIKAGTEGSISPCPCTAPDYNSLDPLSLNCLLCRPEAA